MGPPSSPPQWKARRAVTRWRRQQGPLQVAESRAFCAAQGPKAPGLQGRTGGQPPWVSRGHRLLGEIAHFFAAFPQMGCSQRVLSSFPGQPTTQPLPGTPPVVCPGWWRASLPSMCSLCFPGSPLHLLMAYGTGPRLNELLKMGPNEWESSSFSFSHSSVRWFVFSSAVSSLLKEIWLSSCHVRAKSELSWTCSWCRASGVCWGQVQCARVPALLFHPFPPSFLSVSASVSPSSFCLSCVGFLWRQLGTA